MKPKITKNTVKTYLVMKLTSYLSKVKHTNTHEIVFNCILTTTLTVCKHKYNYFYLCYFETTTPFGFVLRIVNFITFNNFR